MTAGNRNKKQMKNIYLRLTQSGQALTNPVLATVTGTSGSTPQKPGSLALFSGGKLISGTVGGGIVENRVQAFANQCSRTRESMYAGFSLDNDVDRKDEAICGGSISILLDADPLSSLPLFERMEHDLEAGTPGVLVTLVTILKAPYVNIIRYWITAGSDPDLPDYLKTRAKKEALDMLLSPGSAGFRQFEYSFPGEEQATKVFLEPLFPLPRLVIAGAGHIGKALSHLGKMLDFEVTVADSRSEYANALNLPDADHIIAGDIGKILREIKKDRDTYIVIMTQGHADDAEALRPCIRSGAVYVGMIGSKAKIAKMRAEFISRKWATDEEWQKIYSPVGLDIGSKTVEEIAVSIAAQLVLVRNRNSDQPAGGSKV
jgi:xanthine dehydrogenase accessory factor